ncbi:hypothetical protein GPA19_07910 [Azoarcus indigens]|uniref:Uncharacterized protein n=1 Tax=Azoarcus indigens TaxID=29545 RepID=A0A4R6DYI4_9RHOO|nr:hypothetical protein [Azoarcus indigens]NMG64868.1 hypothetical protein [Azoarcus indigens]TDN50406.1 hypothetical protein C7389_109100 [Azoarcus indigens]
MSLISDFAISKNVRAAVEYFDAAADLAAHKLIIDGRLVGFEDGFVPPFEYKAAVIELYRGLAYQISLALDRPEFSACESFRAWREARDNEKFAPCGWVHRIVNLMMYARIQEDGADLMGDIEFKLIMGFVREWMEKFE